jgi:hypothetical protein
MAKLTIDLQEGFGGEDVVVRVDGREAARQSGVRTKRMLGYAGCLEVEVSADLVTVEIAVLSHKLENRIEVRPGETPYLGVSLSGGQLNLLLHQEPFAYA